MAENLKQLFGDKFFRVPDYQRGYAWQKKQLDDFWNDILEIQQDEINGGFFKHYTGTIFIEKIPFTQIPESEKWLKGVDFYNVVDGQQRLTTIVILLHELLIAGDREYGNEDIASIYKNFIANKNASGNSKIYKFCYIGEQNSFLLNCIFDDNSVIVKQHQDTAYTRNLLAARNFFKDKINQLSTREEREEIYLKLITALQFDIRNISSDLDVQAVFETMNNRGKALTALEKLKNRLIYLVEKLPSITTPIEDKQKLRNEINNAWGKIYLKLAQNPDNILDEDEFLSAHLSLLRSPQNGYTFTPEAAENKLFEMFRNRINTASYNTDSTNEIEQAVTYEKINKYVISLSTFVNLWYDVNNPTDELIQRILLLNSGKEIKVYIAAILNLCNKTEQQNIFVQLEKIIFRARMFQSFVDERTFATHARAIYRDEKDYAAELSELVQLQTNAPLNQMSIATSFARLFEYSYGNKGFHRWGTLKYALFEYEKSLKHEFKETSDRISYSDYNSHSIEHIIPQTFETYWKSTVDSFLSIYPEEQKNLVQKILLNTLGNLTIIKDGKNSELGNKPWLNTGNVKGKKERYSTGSYNEIEISKFENWDYRAIYERGKKIFIFLLNKMGISNDIDDQALKIALFYSDDIFNQAKGISEKQ